MIEVAVIAGLAGYRLTRAVTTDTITEPLRRGLAAWAYPQEELEGGGKSRHVVRQWLFNLLTCPLCLGFWITLSVALAFQAAIHWPGSLEALVVALAACGAQALATLVDGRLH